MVHLAFCPPIIQSHNGQLAAQPNSSVAVSATFFSSSLLASAEGNPSVQIPGCVCFQNSCSSPQERATMHPMQGMSRKTVSQCIRLPRSTEPSTVLSLDSAPSAEDRISTQAASCSAEHFCDPRTRRLLLLLLLISLHLKAVDTTCKFCKSAT